MCDNSRLEEKANGSKRPKERESVSQHVQGLVDGDENRFSSRQKWVIVAFVSFVGLFSPLTATIYFPAIPTLSEAFQKSTEMINLTVTMYMVFQGVAPMVWGPLSDHVGRRSISAACLFILTSSCIGLALVPTNAFWLLMFLRCIQASGSASTIALGAGVIGDISTRSERGGFFGIFGICPMIGPAIGPIIGGALTGSLGWRSIFWFLAISSTFCLIVIMLFQPETLRVQGKNWTHKIAILCKPIIPLIEGADRMSGVSQASRPITTRTPKNPFRIFLNPSIDVLLSISAITCAVFYGVIASISTLFAHFYPFLTETDIGLCFLAVGIGMAVGSLAMGRILNREYATFKRRTEGRSFEDSSKTGQKVSKEETFPLELARLRLVPILSVILAVMCAAYGWCLEKGVHIAVPLVMQFIIGFVTIATMNAIQTIMVDLLPGQSSSVTACNNLIRCTLSAILVSVIDLIIKGIGVGWTYVFHCGLSLMVLPMIYIAIRIGPRYRVKRQRLLQDQA